MDLVLIAPNAKSYDFVIRKAKLDIIDAKNIGKAINLIDQNSGPKLGTVSISFNKNSKDEGVISILINYQRTHPSSHLLNVILSIKLQAR